MSARSQVGNGAGRSRHGVGRTAGQTAKRATTRGPVQLLGRVGIVGYGVVHFLLGYLCLRLALGGSTRETDKNGALQQLMGNGGGKVLIWVIALGLVALVIWELAEAAWGYQWIRPQKRRTRKRIIGVGRAILFGTVAVSAAKLAAGSATNSSGKQKTFTAKVLALPFGQTLVGLVGLAIVVIAAYVVYYGWSKRFTEDLDLYQASPGARKAAIRLGQVGLPALGGAYGIVGILVIFSAITYDPQKAAGLDGALKTLAAQPFGTFLLLLIAAGLACFGVYCLFDARYRRG